MSIENNTIEIQLSKGLVPLLKDFYLSERIAELRNQMQDEYTIKLPLIMVSDNLSLAPNTYVIKALGYKIEHKAVLDKNDYNKTAEIILKEISKNMKYNIKLEMYVIVDKEYTSGQKMVEVITTNSDDEWKNHPFLSFKEAA